MKAKKKPVDVKDAAALGVSADAKAKVGKFIPPPARPPGKIICADDTPEGKAAEVAKLLREEAKVI
jgi:electron transfer flavoprotein beta subunit